VVTVDRGTSSEEKMLCSSYTSTQLTVTRGYDGTSAVSHSNGATCEHTLDATQIDAHDAIVYGVGQGTPSTQAIGDSATKGTNTTQPAAGDHKHAMPAAATPGNSAPGDAAAEGSGPTVAYSDHKHGRESEYASVTSRSFTNTNQNINVAAGEFSVCPENPYGGCTLTLPSAPAQFTRNALALALPNDKDIQILAGAGDSLNGYQGNSIVTVNAGCLIELIYIGTTWYAN